MTWDCFIIDLYHQDRAGIDLKLLESSGYQAYHVRNSGLYTAISCQLLLI